MLSCSIMSNSLPWTVALQAPLSMGFTRQGHWSGLPFPSPWDLPDPGIKPGSPALWADSKPSEPPGKPTVLRANKIASKKHKNVEKLALNRPGREVGLPHGLKQEGGVILLPSAGGMSRPSDSMSFPGPSPVHV